MLQIDHVYEFFYQNLFTNFECYHFRNGVINPHLGDRNIQLFTLKENTETKLFFYDQEPFLSNIVGPYVDRFMSMMPKNTVLVTSEHSDTVNQLPFTNKLYYFFHGFAALDWYRGYYALNYSKPIIKNYKHDFISFNRIINNDRSYRIYLVSLLKEHGLLDKGLVSFGVTDNLFDDWRDEVSDNKTKLSKHARRHAEHHLTSIDKLVIDQEQLPGSASANIPRTLPGWWPNNDQPKVDAFWHIVTETVFYYDKLHLTEKIFKPIVSKQPFMLLAAPGNLAYLKSYGFETFDRWIDESYDTITDPDKRIEAVVEQIKWWTTLSDREKAVKMCVMSEVIEHNFHHFYGKFKEIIANELLTNCQQLFKDINFNDSSIDYQTLYKLITS